MEILEAINPVESYLCDMASMKWNPIATTFELLPACNMDCKMCYVRMSMKEMQKRGKMMDADEWINIGKQVVDEGVLFILLTGGEPLLHPEFMKIYDELRRLGLVVNINTNATLIDEKMADFFLKNKPRRINISLYGASNETYSRLCNNPKGFTQVENAIKLLKERDIHMKLNFCITPYNIMDVEKMVEFAEKYEIPVAPTTYMYPPNRKDNVVNYDEHRLSPKQAAQAKMNLDMIEKGDDFVDYAKDILNDIKNIESEKLNNKDEKPQCGFGCRAGNSTFWINWQGEMTSCGMLSAKGIDIKEYGINQSWKMLNEQVSSTKRNSKCPSCKYKNICQVCVASCQAETGEFDGVPQYLCDMCVEYEKLLVEYINKKV